MDQPTTTAIIVNNPETAQLITSWYELKLQKQDLEKQLASLEDKLNELKTTIIDTVFHKEPGVAILEKLRVKHTIVTSSRIDTVKLKKDMPNIAKAFTVQYSYSTLAVEDTSN